MGAAFGWGLLAGSSLVIGAVIAFLIRIPLRVIGLIMGFGSGVLISAAGREGGSMVGRCMGSENERALGRP